MEFPDNSNPATPPKAEEKVVKRVVPKGDAKKVKRPASKRFADFLIAESPKEIAKNVGKNLVIPRLKASFEEAFNSFLAGLLWSDGSGRPASQIVRGTVLNNQTQVYGGVVNGGVNAQAAAALANASRGTTSGYQDLKVGTHQYAEDLLRNLYELHNQYHMVSVADLYESAQLPMEPADNKIGWFTLEGARIEQARDGFILALPRPTRLA